MLDGGWSRPREGLTQSTTVRSKTSDLPTSPVDFINDFHGIEMVDSRIEARRCNVRPFGLIMTAENIPNLVHDRNSSFLSIRIQLPHSIRDIASSNDIILVSNRRLDHIGVESIGYQTDDQFVFCNLGIEGFLVVDIERDRVCILDSRGKLLGSFEGSASYMEVRFLFGRDKGRLIYQL